MNAQGRHQTSAELTKTSVPRLFRAWCEDHQDGYNGSKQAAQKWADKHNATHHPQEAQT